MSILGIDRITYGVEDMAKSRKFFLDWGLALVREDAGGSDFESLNGGEVWLRRMDDPSLPAPIEAGSTVREVLWGVAAQDDIDRLRAALGAGSHVADADRTLRTTDPNGLSVGFRVTQKRTIAVKGVPINAWGQPGRGVNLRSTVYEHARPIEVGHVVFFTDQLAEMEAFYTTRLGFVAKSMPK